MLGRFGTLATAIAGPTWWGVQHARSAAVQRWEPSRLTGRRVGELYVRSGGSGGRVVVLLHGLVASGDIFGRDFDALPDAVAVVPDLLGFGRSLDETRPHFAPEDHLDVLDQMLIDLDLADRPLVIGAHSMGAALALRWAARLGAGVERIVCWGAPVYSDADAVDDALVSTGVMARLFAADTRWARRACEWNCRHRTAAGWVAAALAPSMPVTIARAASLHSWPAYRDAMAELIGKTDWPDLAARVTGTGASLHFVWGEADRIGDRGHLYAATGSHPLVVPGGGHHLPMTHAAWVRVPGRHDRLRQLVVDRLPVRHDQHRSRSRPPSTDDR